MTNAAYQNKVAVGNLPTAPSLLDKARAQARANNAAVWFATEHGAQFAFPSDSRTGEVWPMRSLGYESIMEAESALEARGWRVEGLAA